MPSQVSTRTVAASWRPARPGRRLGRRAWLAAALALGLLAVANWTYHVAHKPSELLAPLSPAFAKTPRQTWEAYGSLFRAHSTDVVPATLLAALAQVEGQGNPLAATYWRWEWSWNPLEIYRPASSAVGMFQLTDAMFREASRYCIRNHAVVRDGPWYDVRSCWFNSLYSRVVPSHAIELTAVHLHRSVTETLARRRITRATSQQQQDLAAVTHLCGARRGEAFARRGFHAAAGERCGDHGVRRYLERVNRMKRQFAGFEVASD